MTDFEKTLDLIITNLETGEVEKSKAVIIESQEQLEELFAQITGE